MSYSVCINEDWSIHVRTTDILNCCGLVGLQEFNVYSDSWGLEGGYPSREEVEDAYVRLAKGIIDDIEGKVLLLACDPDKDSGYSEGYNDSSRYDWASLADFCEYHGFAVTEQLHKHTGKVLNLYSLVLPNEDDRRYDRTLKLCDL